MRWFVKKPADEAARPALVRPVAQRAVRIVAEGTASVPVYAAGEETEAAARLLRAGAVHKLDHRRRLVTPKGDEPFFFLPRRMACTR